MKFLEAFGIVLAMIAILISIQLGIARVKKKIRAKGGNGDSTPPCCS